MTRTNSILAIALCGVWGSALACGDAPMSMKDAAAAAPAVVASASRTTAMATTAQATAKSAPVVTTQSTTRSTKVEAQSAAPR